METYVTDMSFPMKAGTREEIDISPFPLTLVKNWVSATNKKLSLKVVYFFLFLFSTGDLLHLETKPTF